MPGVIHCDYKEAGDYAVSGSLFTTEFVFDPTRKKLLGINFIIRPGEHVVLRRVYVTSKTDKSERVAELTVAPDDSYTQIDHNGKRRRKSAGQKLYQVAPGVSVWHERRGIR